MGQNSYWVILIKNLKKRGGGVKKRDPGSKDPNILHVCVSPMPLFINSGVWLVEEVG